MQVRVEPTRQGGTVGRAYSSDSPRVDGPSPGFFGQPDGTRTDLRQRSACSLLPMVSRRGCGSELERHKAPRVVMGPHDFLGQFSVLPGTMFCSRPNSGLHGES